MNENKLLKFIHEAHQHTYAAPREIKKKYRSKKPVYEGHKEYTFTNKNFKYIDSYAGWKWPPGKELVFYNKKPIWCMSYQGKISDNLSKVFIEKVYSFLKKALMQSPEKMPFRGPKKYSEGNFRYNFKIEGNYKYFAGRESVNYKGKKVFFQDIMGSLIK